MDLDSVSVHKHAKKELGQYPAILTSHLVNNPYLFQELVLQNGESCLNSDMDTRSASEAYKALHFGHKLFFADVGKWLVTEEHLPIILCPVFALWTPLNTLIHSSGRNQTLGRSCKGILDSWNCNFRIRSKIVRHRCFYCCIKKEAGFSFHWRMTFSQTAYFKSEQSLLPTSLLQNSSSILAGTTLFSSQALSVAKVAVASKTTRA